MKRKIAFVNDISDTRTMSGTFRCAGWRAGIVLAAMLAAAAAGAAEPATPSTGPDAAPPPPPMVDDRAAAKADPSPAATPENKKPDNLGDPELEPQVTITQHGDERHEEVRINGKIKYIKVTPKIGPVYYLIPYPDGGETYLRRDSLDSTLRGPMWEIYSW